MRSAMCLYEGWLNKGRYCILRFKSYSRLKIDKAPQEKFPLCLDGDFDVLSTFNILLRSRLKTFRDIQFFCTSRVSM
jgi:hypothetical protein